MRAVLLFAVLAISYSAQYVFDHRTVPELADLSGGPLGMASEWLPGTETLASLSPEERVNLALLLLAASSLGFGLLSPRWKGDRVDALSISRANIAAPRTQSRAVLFIRWLGGPLITVALLLTIFVAIQVGTLGTDTFDVQAVWLIGLLLFLVGSSCLDGGMPFGGKPELVERIDSDGPEADLLVGPTVPHSSWSARVGILVVLVACAMLFMWKLNAVPVRIDRFVAEAGLQSLAILRGEAESLFHPGTTGLPMMAYMPSVLMILVSGNPLTGVRLAGAFSGLLIVFGTWLLASELFRRTSQIGPYGTVWEDDGRWIALIAASVVGFGHVMAHYSRVPILLGPVGWGTAGLWSLLRGLRTRDTMALGLSGMFIGLASVTYTSGLVFLIIAPIWWIGIWLLNRHWLYSENGVGSRGFIVWLVGLTAIILPVLGVWGRLPLAFSDYSQGNLFYSLSTVPRIQGALERQGIDFFFIDNLRLTLLTFNIYPNIDTFFDFPGPFVNSLLAPLLFLGLGGLILNSDKLIGWLLLSAFGCGIILASVSLNAPFWNRLLPILPILALIIAFALDRIRLILLETVGSWLEQTTVFITIGLIVWAGVSGWLAYYRYANFQSDPVSYAGRAIMQADRQQSIVLIVPEVAIDNSLLAEDLRPLAAPSNSVQHVGSSVISLANPVIQFLASDLEGMPQSMQLVAGQWPDQLPAESRIVLQPEHRHLLHEIESRYGKGKISLIRNIRSDPVLYIYDIDAAGARTASD